MISDIIVSGAKVAKQKIKERKEIAAEKQADKDAEKISKMGDLATQFTSSFEDILSEVRTRTCAEQEQIYIGFLKLMEQQHGLLVARKDLAAKLKGSVQTKPSLASTTKPHPLRGKEQPRLSKEPELPQLPSISQEQRQLSEIVTPSALTKDTSEELKTTKPQTISPSKKESHEQIKGGKSSGSTTEPTVTEIPSAELPTKKQKITTATDKEDSIMTKKRQVNRKVDSKST
jgi:hypothetical protein